MVRLQAVYVNTGDVSVPESPDGAGHDASAQKDIGVPVGAVAIRGWRLGAFAKNRLHRWGVTLWLSVNDVSCDFLKIRETFPVGPTVMLPSDCEIPLGPSPKVELYANFFNEDSGITVTVRCNAWIWFALRGEATP